jgi:hypothetical protein
LYVTGADPGFQVRGSILKKIAPGGGRREIFGGISCEKARFYAKKSFLFQFGGGGVPGAPPLDLPLYKVQLLIKGPFLGSIECPIYTGLTVRVSIKEVVNTVMIVMVC